MSSPTESALQFAAYLFALSQPRSPALPTPDKAWWLTADAAAICRDESDFCLQSLHIAMPDGVKLAADVYLPAPDADADSDNNYPTMLVQTRYFRRMQFHSWAAPLTHLLDIRHTLARRIVNAGYALVIVDVRGTGASFGRRDIELGDQEASDGAALCDWIVRQPWSNGHIAASGTSYEGSTAELLMRRAHPALKAVVIRYSLFDHYQDVIAPGGVRGWFVSTWSDMIAAMDQNRLPAFLNGRCGGLWSLLEAAGCSVMPVDGDSDRRQLAQALIEHSDNAELEPQLREIVYLDDLDSGGHSLQDNAPSAHVQAMRASATPVCSWSGWFDGGYPYAAVKRWLALGGNTPGSAHQLILGPWDHGTSQLPEQQGELRAPAFDGIAATLRFVKPYMTSESRQTRGTDAPVHYYTLNSGTEGGWKQSDCWPPQGFATNTLYLQADATLSPDAPTSTDAADPYRVNFNASSGLGARWQSTANLRGMPIGYPDRAEQDKLLLAYDSPALRADTELTGHPIIELFLTADTRDTAVHAYLEELRSDGSVAYVTEGVLRAIHRKPQVNGPPWEQLVPCHSFLRADAQPLQPGEVASLHFGLQPVSYRFSAGSRIRVAIAGADRDNFERVPVSGAAPNWQVQRSARHPSRIQLPLSTANAFA